MRIHAINAFEGDSLLIESGDAVPRYVLIDGGPRGTYDQHVQHHLRDIVGDGGTIEAAIVSHIDIDHIAGILDLVADLERAQADGVPAPFAVKDLWHNSFAATIDVNGGNLTAGLNEMATLAGRAQTALADSSIAVLGVKEGALLRRNVLKLGIPLNGAFNGKLVAPDELVDPTWKLGSVTFRVVGPTEANLRELRKKWQEWVEDNLDFFAEGDCQAMANADKSVPNLSSIVLLATSPSGTALLTGDARGDHIEQGLDAAGLLDGQGRLHVDLLKMQHHLSNRNVTKDFFRQITADFYLASANGKHDNPDFDALQWLVEAAHEQGRTPTIVVTNKTDATDQLLTHFPPENLGYSLYIRSNEQNAIGVDLSTRNII